MSTNNLIQIPEFTDYNIYSAISDYPSLSIDNEYIPVQALSNGELYTKDNLKILFYKLNVGMAHELSTVRKIPDFMANMLKSRYNSANWLKLAHPSIERVYISSYGHLIYFDEDNYKPIPMVVLAVKKEFLFDVNREEPDPNQFCVLVDKNMLESVEHHKLYRNVKKYYLDEVDKYLDILYTNDIVRLCYNVKSVTPPKFKTIDEIIEHTATMNIEALNSITS